MSNIVSLKKAMPPEQNYFAWVRLNMIDEALNTLLSNGMLTKEEAASMKSSFLNEHPEYRGITTPRA